MNRFSTDSNFALVQMVDASFGKGPSETKCMWCVIERLCATGVNGPQTVSNNICEVEKTLGIESARYASRSKRASLSHVAEQLLGYISHVCASVTCWFTCGASAACWFTCGASVAP